VKSSLKAARTEQRNPRSRGIDRKSTTGILRVLNREDALVARAVRAEIPRIAAAVDAIVKAIERGGRLIYVGAGTSGRLAVLDAAECPPTFGTPPRIVQAIIAGGEKALRHAVEGAEDSARDGARDLARMGVASNDVVVGIAASGTTPYVLGALKFAQQKRAITVGITADPQSPLARLAKVAIAPKTGAEAIAGSTRMKAGTAQKMVLNLLSTTAMIRLGRVYENWMVHVALTNQKLKRRGVRILEEATGAAMAEAARVLRSTQHDLPAALVMLETGTSLSKARRHLAASRGNVRQAIRAASTSRNASRTAASTAPRIAGRTLTRDSSRDNSGNSAWTAARTGAQSKPSATKTRRRA
jgi:N-acetylmuramic acid 6-phosphate etherase